MSDVQVSNARRIGFTALALVSFWVLAWRSYGMAVETGLNPDWTPTSDTLFVHQWRTTAAFAVAPTIFMLVSTHKGVRGLSDPLVVISGLMFAATFRSNIWLGFWDTQFGYSFGPNGRGNDETSWPWLLLPIILTTAFVIWGAWRNAVRARDAEVEEVGEDE